MHPQVPPMTPKRTAFTFVAAAAAGLAMGLLAVRFTNLMLRSELLFVIASVAVCVSIAMGYVVANSEYFAVRPLLKLSVLCNPVGALLAAALALLVWTTTYRVAFAIVAVATAIVLCLSSVVLYIYHAKQSEPL